METDVSEGNVSERVIPTGNVELMFHFKRPFVVTHTGNSKTEQPISMLNGIGRSFADISTQGESGVIAVSFYAYGACCFFDFPLSEAENASLHLCDVLSNEIREIEEQICEANTLDERIAIIERFLMKQFSPVANYDFLLIKDCIAAIKKEQGILHARTLSEKFFVSSKSLERKFASLVGITPKQLIKIERFKKAILELSKPETFSLTKCACNNGYFDQSHFIKEFKMFTGYTPKEYRSRLPQCTTTPDDLAFEFDL